MTRTIELVGAKVTLSPPVQVARSRGFLWFPVLAPLGGDELLAVASSHRDAHVKDDFSAAFRSADGGRSWGPLATLGESGYSHLKLDDGRRLLLPYYMRPRDGGLQGPCVVFSPGGDCESISNGVRVSLARKDRSFAPELGLGGFVFDGQPVRGRAGEHLATVYGHFEGEQRYSSLLLESPDGRTWRQRSVIAGCDCPLEGQEGPCEPTLCRLVDGTLMCIFRLASFATYGQTFSRDDGRTWSPPVALAGTSSVEPSLAVLAGGAVMLSGGRPGIFAWLNVAGDGRRWQQIDMLEHHNALVPPCDRIRGDTSNAWLPAAEMIRSGGRGFTSSYTELATLDESHVLMIYDRLGLGWHAIAEDVDETNSLWVVAMTVER